MRPDVGVLIEPVLRARTAVGHDQRRRVADPRRRPELQHVVVEALGRQVVLEAGVAVGDDRHVHVVQRAALGDDHQAGFARRGDDHLALLAPRLVVVLDRDRALRLQALRRDRARPRACRCSRSASGVRAVDDLAGREDARREDPAGALILGGGEDLASPGSTDRARSSRPARDARAPTSSAAGRCRRRPAGRAHGCR